MGFKEAFQEKKIKREKLKKERELLKLRIDNSSLPIRTKSILKLSNMNAILQWTERLEEK